GSCHAAASLGSMDMLLGEVANETGYVRDTLGTVLDYDEARGTELLRTLDAYFACGGNLTRAKECLHVHVNTVSQRLERIGVLLGDDGQSPERAVEHARELTQHRLS